MRLASSGSSSRRNLKENKLTVTDNGIGLDEQKFKQFLAPSFSFKSRRKGSRGHKGVGATYLAYGFDYMLISTKTNSFSSTGKIENARKWLGEDSPAGNPLISPDSGKEVDPNFESIDRGVSITIGFNKNTHPSKLDWLGAKSADVWLKILSIKTGLGAFYPNKKINISITVFDSAGNKTELLQVGTAGDSVWDWPGGGNLPLYYQPVEEYDSGSGKKLEERSPAENLRSEVGGKFYKPQAKRSLSGGLNPY